MCERSDAGAFLRWNGLLWGWVCWFVCEWVCEEVPWSSCLRRLPGDAKVWGSIPGTALMSLKAFYLHCSFIVHQINENATLCVRTCLKKGVCVCEGVCGCMVIVYGYTSCIFLISKNWMLTLLTRWKKNNESRRRDISPIMSNLMMKHHRKYWVITAL